MMIEALMYGFTPSATTEKVVRPPPENRSSSPKIGLDLRNGCERPSRSTPGTGTWASSRKTRGSRRRRGSGAGGPARGTR